MKTPIYLIFLLIASCIWQAAVARSTAEQEAIRFRILFWDVAPEGIFMSEGGRYLPLNAQPNLISHEYTYSGASPLVLYRRTVAADGTASYEHFETLPLGSGSRDYLLIVRRSGAEKAVRAFMYPYEYSRYGDADLVLFNLTPLPVKAQFGSLLLDLTPGGHRTLALSDVGGEGHSLRCRIASESADGWRLIYNDFVHLNPRAQVLFFIASSEAGNATSANLHTETKTIINYRLSEAERKGSIHRSDAQPTVGGY